MTNTQNPRTITDIRRAQADLENELAGAVAQARTEGSSWTVIGAALGITRQAAQQKYGTKRPDIETLPLSDSVFDVLFQAPQVSSPVDVDAPAPADSAAADDADDDEPTENGLTPRELKAIHSTPDWFAAYGCGECGRKDRPADCQNCHRRPTEARKATA